MTSDLAPASRRLRETISARRHRTKAATIGGNGRAPLSRARLLAGASVIALALIAGRGLQARPLTGGSTPAPATAAVNSATSIAEQAAKIAKQSQDSLVRATQALQSMQAVQAAARAAAAGAASNIADGLSLGGAGKLPGLVVDPRVSATPNLWINADLPTQTSSDGKTTVTIKQTAPQAVMTWLYYNVSPNTTVVYDQQGNPSWVALNRIDATGSPSRILGQIKADGTVLLINPNGIIFGAGAQINTHSLIASSLDIDATRASSVFNANSAAYTPVPLSVDGKSVTAYVPPNEATANANFVGTGSGQGLFSIASLDGVIGNSAKFSMGNQTLSTAQGGGAIVVERGASIATSLNSTGDGGYVALLGPNVTNSGSITTPHGQIILAAEGQVVLSDPTSAATGASAMIALDHAFPGSFGSHQNPDDFGIYGGIGALPLPSLGDAGRVTNDGLLWAQAGAVSINGYNGVTQSGVLGATTSVNRPASISISGFGNVSPVVFGPNSVTAILPDEGGDTVPDGTATADYFTSFLQPKIAINGPSDFQSGSLLRAPSAAVSLNGLTVLESGATIDVSGLADVQVPLSKFIVSFLVTPNEIADSPLSSALVGKTVTVDTRLTGTRADGLSWVGSPIVDASGYARLIPKTIGEILTAGGSITVSGGDDQHFIQKQGSIVNLSGGYVTYLGGAVDTTQLIGSDGRFYDIGRADPTIAYVGLASAAGFTVEHSRAGTSETFTSPLLDRGHYESTYIAGASAGSLSISVLPLLDGTIIGDTVAGQRQRANAIGGGATRQTSLEQLPAGASLTLDRFSTLPAIGFLLETSAQAGADPYGLASYSFGSTSWTQPATVPLLTDRLSETGFGSITIRATGETPLGGLAPFRGHLNMAEGAILSVAPGGSVSLVGVETIAGSIIAPGGKIALDGYFDVLGSKTQKASDVVLGPNAVLDVRGLWVNDSGAVGDALQGSAFVDGGSVSIVTHIVNYNPNGNVGYNEYPTDVSDATASIILSHGSIIDVSSGGYVGTNGKLKLGSDALPVGKGGSLSLVTYNGRWVEFTPKPNVGIPVRPDVHPTDGRQPTAATVVFDGTIYSGGFGAGGTFTLQAPTITIDGRATSIASYTSGERAGEIVLPSSFFTDNGFSNYVLTSVHGSTTVTAGTKVLLRRSNYLTGDDSILSRPTGAIARDFATVGLAPYGLRNPVSLTLAERGYIYGGTGPSTTAGVLLEEGASIVAEASLTKRATINLIADGPVTVLGGITAPGGTISLSSDLSGSTGSNSIAARDVWIGSTALLDVSGVFLPDPTVPAYQTGGAIDAGTISLSAETIVAETGSLFRLDGASGRVEIPAGSALGPEIVHQDVWSNGGSLLINPSTASYFAGTVSAHGGAPRASGGSLTIGNPRTFLSIVVEPDGLIGATLAKLSNGRYPLTPAELATKTPPLAEYVQIAYIGADTLNNSGFDSISLLSQSGTIAFNGSQSIHVPGSLILGLGSLTLMPASDGLLPSGVTDPNFYRAAACGTGCVPTIGGSRVDLSAGYIGLRPSSNNAAAATLADGVLNITAKWIDVGQPYNGLSGGSNITFRNVGAATLTSADAIRLLGYANNNSGSTYTGSLTVAGDLTLAAAEIYPTSGTRFTIRSTSATGTIDIEQTGVASQPLSAGGTLTLDAANIVQNGTLWAPFGQIVLGNATTTRNVTLGAGSLTSVSGAGSAVPYGFTVDGEAWYVGNAGYVPSINNPGYQGDLLTAAPAKAITLNGANVATSAGATLDLSGGGDIYASEFVAGVGGSRNVLTTDKSGATVYALVPASSAKVAAYDPTFAFSEGPFGQSLLSAQPGTAVYLTGGNGIPAGAYTLMPGLYATLPGAYRVVVASSSVKTADPQNYTTADGSNYVTGYFANSITGARSSQAMLFRLQSASSWTKYSQIDITSGSAFLRNAALAAGSAIPVLPIDGGALTLAARSTLSLASTNHFAGGASPLAPSLSGVNGQLAVSAAKILVLAKDQAAPAASTGYLLLDADQLSNSGATTLLLGGSSSVDNKGALVVTAFATDVEIETDAAHPLTAPQLILASRAGGKGITVDDGSVIAAVGTVPAGGDRPISVTGDGSLLRVSTGSMVDFTRASANAGAGQIAIGTAPGTTTLVSADTAVGVTINGGAALTIDSSGDSRLAGKVALNASAYDLGGGVVNVAGGSSGLALSREVIANFAGATSVRLRSASVINFYDANGLTIGDSDKPIGTLTFDGSGLYGEGGTTTVNAENIVLTSSRTAPSAANALAGSNGALTLSASDTITFDKNFAAGAGAFTLGGFGRIDVKAANAVRFAGVGAYQAVNVGGLANVAFSTPNIVAAAASVQSFTASGALTTASSGAPTAVAANETGGGLTLSGTSVSVSSAITALSGTLILDATSGDVALGEGAFVNAGGSRVALGPDIEYAPGGTVRLNALSGNVSIGSGAKVSVAAAGDEYGSGYAGSLYITTADTGTTTLSGTLDGSAAFKDTGGNFILSTGRLAGTLPWNGFSRRFSVTLNQPGDLVIGAGETLVAGEVMLVANQGSVIVNGAIDASGVDGKIALYGSGTKSGGVTTGGVAIGATALLDARFVAPDADDPGYANGTPALVPNGGTITLGTTGRANGTVNTAGCGGSGCGYQNVDSADAGWIDVAAGAQFDVRGGAGGVGGQVTLRAPLLTNNNLNVRFAGTLITSGTDGAASGNGVVLNAYATWSATDPTTAGLSRHFDGIIDPAGWYTSAGTLVAGWTQRLTSSTDATRADIIYTAQAAGGSIAQGAIFTSVNGAVDNTNYAHADFYQKTLVSFVQNPFNGNAAAVAANFSGARQIVLTDATRQIDKTAATALAASQLHLRPEISLVNPSKAINGGNISVLSNWNLGGVQTAPVASGLAPLTSYTPAYRTKGPIDPGEPGALSLRAINNVDIRATISDGFYEAASAFYRTYSGGWQSHSYALVANLIANNPAIATGTTTSGAIVRLTEWNTTSAASLMSIGPGNLGSFSYDFVAGAAFGAFAPANPDAVVPVAGAVSPMSPTSSVTIDGHTSYVGIYSDSGLIRFRTHYIPTLVRTGTGSIRLTAAGNVEFTDTTVQGAVYTAGALAATPADYRPPTSDTFRNIGYISDYLANPNGLESFIYTGLLGIDGNPLRQRYFGAGGGSLTIEAGQSIIGFEQTTKATSTPWTGWYSLAMESDKDSTPFSGCYGRSSGCQSTAYVNYASFSQNFGALGGGSLMLRAGRDVTDISVALPEGIAVAGGFDVSNPPHAVYYGGGNLLAQIGGNLNSSVFFVGRGGARIEVGGAIQQTADNPLTAAKDPTAFPLLLAAQDSYFDTVAAGSVTLRVSDPTYNSALYSNSFTSYGPQSGLSVTSLGGNVSATGTYLPPNLKIAALKGDITNAGGTMFDLPTDLLGHGVGSLVLAAAGSINAAVTLDAPVVTGATPPYINPLGLPSYSLAPAALTNSDPVLVSAGKDITGTLIVDRPAEIIAGRDVTLNFTGVNLDESDVTSIIAGRDIVSATSGVFGSTYGLYGPGAFLLKAGRNIGRKVNSTSFNVSTYGNGSGGGLIPNTTQPVPLKSYLPAKGADIYVLYGIANGVDYASAISAYVDPASAGANGIDFLADIAGVLGLPRDQAWTAFQGMSPTRQQLLVDRAFLDFLTEVATDYRNPSSPYYAKYGRAYEAIGTLFPKGLGYANDGSGGADPAAVGRLSIPFSLIQTQLGGDINIIGPVGGIKVGSAGRDNKKPYEEGILTLRGGAIRIYTDQSVLVNQSRIMTLQGGDVNIFSGNGDILAGSGPKTYVSNPVLQLVCAYYTGYCAVNPQGLVTGAGIGAILTLPSLDPEGSNATLAAPRGTVDAGAAGIRVAGNLNIVAQHVANVYNIQVQGNVSGLQAPPPGPNVAALTAGSNQAGAGAKAVETPRAGNDGSDAPSLITVEILGYGGSDRGEPAERGGASAPAGGAEAEEERRRRGAR